MVCEEEFGERQEHHKGEDVIRNNIEFHCSCTDHVEMSFLGEASMVLGLIVLLNFMVNCIYM